MGKILPKLKYGEGTLRWVDEEKGIICYRKQIKIGNSIIRTSVLGSSVQEVMLKMNEKEHQLKVKKSKEPQTILVDSNQILKNKILVWLETYKLPTLKGKSYDTLEGIYKTKILDAPFANAKTELVSSTEIQIYLNQLSQRYSKSTVKKVFSLLKQFFDYYYKTEPYKNPMIQVQLPKMEQEIVLDKNNNPVNPNDLIILDDNEIKIFDKYAMKPLQVGIGGSKYGCFLSFIMWTFIRVGEALALQWKDIDWKEESFLVYKTYSRVVNRDDDKSKTKWQLTTAKTMNSIRKVYMCHNAVNALKTFKERQNPKSEDEFIAISNSGKIITDRYLNESLSNIMKHCKIEKHITVHGLRHTGISYFLRHGVDINVVSKMAGHSDPSITAKIYYNILTTQKNDAIEKINMLNEVLDENNLELFIPL